VGKIGNAKEFARLYLLKVEDPNKNIKTSHVVSSKDDVMLWHYGLGCPNFAYMEKLLPTLFNKHSFKCELAKHTKSHYPIQLYKPSYPFSLIQCGVWEPSHVNNVTSSKSFVTFKVVWVFPMKEKS